MASDEKYEYEELSFSNKLTKKVEEAPFVLLGVCSVVGSCLYAAYRYKTRGPAISTSIFLMQLRLYAQGMFAGFAALGIGTKVFQDAMRRKNEENEEKKTLQS